MTLVERLRDLAKRTNRPGYAEAADRIEELEDQRPTFCSHTAVPWNGHHEASCYTRPPADPPNVRIAALEEALRDVLRATPPFRRGWPFLPTIAESDALWDALSQAEVMFMKEPTHVWTGDEAVPLDSTNTASEAQVKE